MTNMVEILSIEGKERYFDLTFRAEGPLAEARPGQFLMVACGEERMLRRPISVCDLKDGVMRLVFEAKGEGTEWLSQKKPGDMLDVMGPLGNGFDLMPREEPVLFVGGGIGAAPLFYALRSYEGKAGAILGFRTADDVLMKHDFFKAATENYKSYGLEAGYKTPQLVFTTDDGSYGIGGTVALPLEDALEDGEAGMIFACGPKPMLRAVAALAKQYNIPCQVSLEERMGCGVGACLCCAVPAEKDGEKTYARVCRDGPVFSAEEVSWDDE